MKWTFTASTWSLLLSAVLGLFSVNAIAATNIEIYNPQTSAKWQGTTSYASKQEACIALMHARLDGYAASYPVHVMNYTTPVNANQQYSWLPYKEGCKVELFINGNMGGAYQTFLGYYVEACATSTTDQTFVVAYGQGETKNIAELKALQDVDTKPASVCMPNGKLRTFGAEQTPFFDTSGLLVIGNPDYVQYARLKQVVTVTDTCTACTPVTCTASQVKNAFGVCKTQCTPPEVLTNGTCQLPACPAGTERVGTSTQCVQNCPAFSKRNAAGMCEEIKCTPPMVKKNNQCELPKCPTGESLEVKNGLAKCVPENQDCLPPKVMVNGVCELPKCPIGTTQQQDGTCKKTECPQGTSLNAQGQCKSGDCAVGTTKNAAGICVATQCPQGQTVGASGACVGTDNPQDVRNNPITGDGTTSGTGTGGTGSGTGTCDPATTECSGATFGGSCESDFECTGDAVQCAVATATNKAECLLQLFKAPKETTLAQIGDGAINGESPAGTLAGVPKSEFTIGNFNSTNPLGATCPQDVNLGSFLGHDLIFPLSKFCGVFQILGYLILIIATMISIRIVMKGV